MVKNYLSGVYSKTPYYYIFGDIIMISRTNTFRKHRKKLKDEKLAKRKKNKNRRGN